LHHKSICRQAENGDDWDIPDIADETRPEKRERIQEMRERQQMSLQNEDSAARSERIAQEEEADREDPARHPLYTPKRMTKTGRGLWFPSPTGCAHPSPPEELPPA
jgi:hypothetical protein